MRQVVPKRCCKLGDEKQGQQEANNAFLPCAELVLPWLTPPELANISLTCQTLDQISQSITIRRVSNASRNFEDLPIPFHNAVDDHPYAYFIYTRTLVLSYPQFQRQCWGSNSDTKSDSMVQFCTEPLSLVDEWGESITGCDCEKCGDVGVAGFGCPCLSLEGLDDLVSECGPRCGCGFECGNRLTQRGVSVRLKIVKDRRKGWGLYADECIQKGQFVCEYAGELLTTEEAKRRQQTYDERAIGGHVSSALLVVREHLPSGKACLRMNIDATRIGNVARFINHSCDGGNLVTKLVRSSGTLLPHLCFFASRNIGEDEELSFSYGDTRLRPKGLECFCGSSSCLGVLPSEVT